MINSEVPIPEIRPNHFPRRRPLEIWPDQPRWVPDLLWNSHLEPQRINDVPPPELVTQMGCGGKPPGSETAHAPGGMPDGFPCVDEISHYVSFRYRAQPGRDLFWGVVVEARGVCAYTSFLQQVHKASAVDAHHAAWHFIVLHQTHHFLVDRAIWMLEAVGDIAGLRSNTTVWETFRSRGRSALEESACCAYALRSARTSRTSNAPDPMLIRHLIDEQPEAYRQHSACGSRIHTETGPVRHHAAISELLSSYVRVSPERVPGIHGLMLYANQEEGVKADLFFGECGDGERLPVHLIP